MGYAIKLEATDGRECVVCRSRHTGDWILQEKNQHYGYYATIRIFGQRLGLNELSIIADKLSLDPMHVKHAAEDVVREGNAGMIPAPLFTFTEGVTI